MLFASMLGTHVPRPTTVAGAQFQTSTRVSFVAPGVLLQYRAEKETAPGSGVWTAFGTGTLNASTTETDIATYTENGSYRIRFERQGIPSDWTTFSTPLPYDPGVNAPSGVSIASISGVTVEGDITPSEPNCATRYQFLDNALTVVAEGLDVSDGVPSAMGPYFTAQVTAGMTFRARHERSGWESAWTSDSL